MSREEAMKLIEGGAYADEGRSYGWAARTSKLVRAACEAALIRRGQRPGFQKARGADWLWSGNRTRR